MTTFKRFDNFSNVDKSNRFMSKQNRERQNDFFQQFVVYDSQFFQFFFDYIFYQFQNFTYTNQKSQYQFYVERKSVFSALIVFKQQLQITSKNESNSRNQSQKQKSKSTTNEKKFENRFKQIYVVNKVDEKFDEVFQKQQKKNKQNIT